MHLEASLSVMDFNLVLSLQRSADSSISKQSSAASILLFQHAVLYFARVVSLSWITFLVKSVQQRISELVSASNNSSLKLEMNNDQIDNA